MAGYSGTPLARKLGIKEGSAVAWVNPPAGFDDLLAPVPPSRFTEAAALDKRLPALTNAIFPPGGLWIA